MVLKRRYTPKPISTSGVNLDQDLERLVERLAANAHEVWARGRLRDGWRYGPKRNDARRTHPCLVPYDELPESEKTYDRRLVNGTLKAALALGYDIRKPASRKMTRTR